MWHLEFPEMKAEVVVALLRAPSETAVWTGLLGQMGLSEEGFKGYLLKGLVSMSLQSAETH